MKYVDFEYKAKRIFPLFSKRSLEKMGLKVFDLFNARDSEKIKRFPDYVKSWE